MDDSTRDAKEVISKIPIEEPILQESKDVNIQEIESKARSDGQSTSSNKKVWICSFCNKPFSHQGSYGKHLDYKKGDALHPKEEIERIRSTVKRRDGTSASTKPTKKAKVSLATSKVAAKSETNRNEITKIRRKLRDRHIKSKLLTQQWLLDKFGNKETTNANFAEMVSSHLAINQWPASYPDSQTYELVSKSIAKSQPSLSNKLLDEFIKWQNLTQLQKQELWTQAKTEALNSTIGDFCVHDLANIKNLVNEQEKLMFEQICQKDGLLQYVNQKQNLPILLDLDSGSDQDEEFNKYFEI